VIDLRGQQLIQHIHRCREQHALIRLAGLPADDFSQKCFADSGITDQHDVSALLQEREIE
jgi:hypothetical protein